LAKQGRVEGQLTSPADLPSCRKSASTKRSNSINVSMNIAGKGAFYGEIHRVLKPRGWLMLSEVAKGAGGDPDYPTPWANSARTSFLSTPEETRSGLVEAGFDVVQLHSTLERALAFGARSRAVKVERSVN
jgi:hypothetical protein